jgi:hypothetical protein
MRHAAASLLLVTVLFIGRPLDAQSPVDLRGSWSGTAVGVVAGELAHSGSTPLGEPKFSSLEWTMVIEKQDGRRLTGKRVSARATESLIGVLSVDNATAYMVDEGGTLIVRLISKTTLEACYMEVTPKTRVATCTMMRKKV